jgi:uncharacterized linocin/CFP29 family protein
MNNLHRELAPVSDAAWRQIDDEAGRTLKRHLAGRRVVDVHGPEGDGLSAIGTGHLVDLEARGEGLQAWRRTAQPLVQLRIPFELPRRAVDDVERGARDADWQPVKDAAREIAFAEDQAIFDGYPAGQISGIRDAAPHGRKALPGDPRAYPEAIAEAISQLRLAGVNGPYNVVLSAEGYPAVSETSDHGYPVLDQIRRLTSEEIVWAPAIDGAFVLSTRGGDFALHIGQDFAIGYEDHDARAVRLYIQETFTFLNLAPEAATSLTPAGPG